MGSHTSGVGSTEATAAGAEVDGGTASVVASAEEHRRLRILPGGRGTVAAQPEGVTHDSCN